MHGRELPGSAFSSWYRESRELCVNLAEVCLQGPQPLLQRLLFRGKSRTLLEKLGFLLLRHRCIHDPPDALQDLEKFAALVLQPVPDHRVHGHADVVAAEPELEPRHEVQRRAWQPQEQQPFSHASLGLANHCVDGGLAVGNARQAVGACAPRAPVRAVGAGGVGAPHAAALVSASRDSARTATAGATRTQGDIQAQRTKRIRDLVDAGLGPGVGLLDGLAE
mmetsp:Transcript_124522/g.363590  ORF Transcript_124522/g.363590 Transcript_124522/m.363590 type:complete len:222 (-) Transcript_124522:182-847(-)